MGGLGVPQPSLPQMPKPTHLGAWVLALRPATLPVAVVPVLVGTAAALAAENQFRLPVLVAALVASLLIQIGTNLANDLFDFKTGADTKERLGPVRVTQAGLLSPRQVGVGIVITFALSVLVGLYLIDVGGWPILLIGLLSIAAGILYTGGPWPLGYNGLGDLFVFLFFGVIAVVGTYYVQVDSVNAFALACSIPVGLLATAILIVNNLRDIETDRAAGKRTMAVRIGPKATRAQYALFVLGAYAVPVILWLTGLISGYFWLPWLTLPLAIRLARSMLSQTSGPALNGVLKQTAQLHLLFGLLFAGSLLLS